MKLNRDILLAIIVVAMIGAVGFVTPVFVQADHLAILFNDTAILIMMALGQMTVILTKCIDLSVAANVAFTGVVVALINVAYPGLPIPAIMLIAALMGLVLGAFNGILVWLVGIPSIVVTLGTLSGGNQQKVVIGKWLATTPRVIILDEPTKGIDVGSKAAVHAFMGELVGQGLAVIMVSSEIPEILGMSDRVIVMREGRIAGAFDRSGLTAETLVAAATGNVTSEAA